MTTESVAKTRKGATQMAERRKFVSRTEEATAANSKGGELVFGSPRFVESVELQEELSGKTTDPNASSVQMKGTRTVTKRQGGGVPVTETFPLTQTKPLAMHSKSPSKPPVSDKATYTETGGTSRKQESQIEALESLGFDGQHAARALQVHNGNVKGAVAELLFESPSKK